jgi:hypothetical protein
VTAQMTQRIPLHDRAAVAQRVNDEAVVLNTRTEGYFSLNEVGARVWDLVDGNREVPAIVATLLDEYDVEAAALRTDVDELLADLARHELISWVDARA